LAVIVRHKKLTASGKLGTGGGDSADAHVELAGVQLVGGSDAATVIGYKAGAATAGKEFMKLSASANTEGAWKPGNAHGLQSQEGWYFAITGTEPAVHVYHT